MGGPSSGTLEEGQVQAMFDRVAGPYDLINSIMTAGLHHRWRARAVDLAAVGARSRLLDVATGTGDLALEASSRGVEVVGCDFSEEMLARARVKAADTAGGPTPVFEEGNALHLSYPSDSFDAATTGFAARNFSDLGQGVSEMTRVVRPGGRVVILEITTPTKPPLSTFFGLWFDRIVPVLGRLAGDSDAYQYLPASVRRFPGPRGVAAVMEQAGLQRIRWILTAGGIIALHVGEKPAR